MSSQSATVRGTTLRVKNARAWRFPRWYWIVGFLVFLITGLVLFSTRRDVVSVQVVQPKYEDMETSVSTTGSVVPLDEFPARANFSGMVDAINVHLGEKVHPGQLLVTMKDQYARSRLEQARATLDAAEAGAENVENNGSTGERIGFEADLEKARREQATASASLASLRQLLQRGSVSQAEVEAAEQRLRTADANIQTMQAQDAKRYSPKDLASWKDKVSAARSAYEAEKISYGNAYVTSPVAGTVYTIPIARYDFVPAGADLLRVADLTHIQVHADFDEPDLAKLHNGEPAKITWDGKPGYTWHGHVLHAPMAVTVAGPRSIGMCTITVDDATGDLPADSHVTVNVTTGVHPHVLSVPREALHFEGANRFVYRVVDGKLAKTPVTVGLANLFEAEITSGLKQGDTIAMHALQGDKLESGLKVREVH